MDRVPDMVGELATIRRELQDAREAIGRVESRQLEEAPGPLQRHEFRVYSHAGEDGIIQFLINAINVPSHTFIEFGVEDYREANTRFLLLRNGWRGLVLDGDPENVARIHTDALYTDSDLTAISAFVTRENINDVIAGAGFGGDLGLLSVDVDGNDYWIFDAISVVRPAIAVVEYNHRFGRDRLVTIPYDPGFVRRRTDSTWLICGASLGAIVAAANRKGMSFVGCNTFGNNAFFVRTDLLPSGLPALSAKEGYVAGRFRESMLIDGREVVSNPDLEQSLIAAAKLEEVP